ncbi:hypothetical protein CFP56_014796 [Quercus suber]|uniref:Uncharacterized protein n=1 Tax=Quercus suber TaxID=58331 RepID=A0AAW0KTL3_QUESU
MDTSTCGFLQNKCGWDHSLC